jgi:hypothetical protein
MTTVQKHEYKATYRVQQPLGPNHKHHCILHATHRFQVSLGNHGIATSDAEKTMAAGAQMWQSEMFMEDQMVVWENNPAALQTWAELQTYFTKKWLGRKQYSATMAKQSHFKEAALL